MATYCRSFKRDKSLDDKLKSGVYKHSSYEQFIIRDPKKRLIHKAAVRDRIVHQLIFDYLRPIFEKRFIFDSYSSRVGKGTYAAVKRLQLFCRQVSRNERQPCWILKCDIKKFFDSIDHKILFSLIKKQISDLRILNLIWKILESYEILLARGLPLGNLSSQLFANIYLHELDFYAKHILKLKYYIRFNDDFVIAHHDKKFLASVAGKMQKFLEDKLLISLPVEKISLRKFRWGIDFLGYIILPGTILPRTKTKRRMFMKISQEIEKYKNGLISYSKICQSISSYLGLLKICKSFKIKQGILSLCSEF